MLVSVRGTARRSVDPDSARLSGVLQADGDDVPGALRAAAGALQRLTADLAAAGGLALTAATGRHALTWSAHRSATEAVHDVDPATGQYRPTGRWRATVVLAVVLRDLARLDEVSALLSRHAGLSVHDTRWTVDEDSTAWEAVRAEAVQAAVRAGHDYAAALGGTVTGVEHLADQGLLDGGGQDGGFRAMSRSAAGGFVLEGGGSDDVPSLDPVPQLLVAVVEARFAVDGATVPPPA